MVRTPTISPGNINSSNESVKRNSPKSDCNSPKSSPKSSPKLVATLLRQLSGSPTPGQSLIFESIDSTPLVGKGLLSVVTSSSESIEDRRERLNTIRAKLKAAMIHIGKEAHETKLRQLRLELVAIKSNIQSEYQQETLDIEGQLNRCRQSLALCSDEQELQQLLQQLYAERCVALNATTRVGAGSEALVDTLAAEIAECKFQINSIILLKAQIVSLTKKKSKLEIDYPKKMALIYRQTSLIWHQLHPLSIAQLEQEKRLLKAIEQTKKRARRMTFLPTFGSNVNRVTEFSTSFFKRGETNSISVPWLEEMAWEMAKILDEEKLFTPTRIVTLTLANGEKIIGSLQPRQQGALLSELLDCLSIASRGSDTFISRKALLHLWVVMLVWGLMDLHGGNIMVNDLQVFLFDNSRCMPNSLEVFLNSMGFIRSVYKPVLLSLPDSYQAFTVEERSEMLTVARHYLTRLDELSDFLENRCFSFPISHKYFNHRLAMEMFKKRLDRLITALDNSSVMCARDLMFSVTPKLKFIAAMTLLYYLNLSKLKAQQARRKWHPLNSQLLQLCYLYKMASHNLEFLFDHVNTNLNVNPVWIFTLCNNKENSFESIVNNLINAVVNSNEPCSYNQHTRIILDHYHMSAAPEFKD